MFIIQGVWRTLRGFCFFSIFSPPIPILLEQIWTLLSLFLYVWLCCVGCTEQFQFIGSVFFVYCNIFCLSTRHFFLLPKLVNTIRILGVFPMLLVRILNLEWRVQVVLESLKQTCRKPNKDVRECGRPREIGQNPWHYVQFHRLFSSTGTGIKLFEAHRPEASNSESRLQQT